MPARRGRHRRPSEPLPFARSSVGVVLLAVLVATATPAASAAPSAAARSSTAFAGELPEGPAAAAVAAALEQLGLPYEWGGDGPSAGETGFDCSGLTHFAYAQAGIDLPRTAHAQYSAGPRVPDEGLLQAGDLVFYGLPERVYHVGMYLGEGRMVNASKFGRPVQVAAYRWPGDEYLGATRPAAPADDPGLLPPVPALPPEPLPVPDVFDAPAALLPEGLLDALLPQG